jgi:hypothetical protein
MLPFTLDQFISILVAYNQAIWPAQIVAYVIGLAMLGLFFRPGLMANRLIAGGLVLMWAWTGIAYHWLQFTTINSAAYGFAALFVVQAAVLFYCGVMRDRLRFGIENGPAAILGAVYVVYAIALYPLIGMWTGHIYPDSPVFGVTPCPVTIFTFGLLLMTTARVPWPVLVIPLLWSLVGGSAAFLLGIQQDWLLLVSGIIAIPVIVMHGRHGHAPTVAA